MIMARGKKDGRPLQFFSRRRIVMLVLSRKRGEKVFIGSDITLMVLDVRGNRVRIGLAAPAHLHIAREEVYDRFGGPPRRARVQPAQMHDVRV
jgi:carbon storage regulator